MLAIVDTKEKAWAEYEAFMVELRRQRLCEHRQQGQEDGSAGWGDTGSVGVGRSVMRKEEGADVPVSDGIPPQGAARALEGFGVAGNLRVGLQEEHHIRSMS